MKRQTAMALAAVFAMSVAGTALAAPANPFVDVPAKHWSYDAVTKLAQAGVVSGYGDGTYKGDRTMTRYEMATIIAKAMANSDKADAELQKTIDALAAEYGAELNNLGVRIDNLEKNASKIKFTGEIRSRYDYQEDVDNDSATRLRLNMEAKVADDVTFHGRYQSESSWGTSGTSKLTQAYITGNAIGLDYSFGRQPIWLGQGMIADLSGNADGLLLSGGKDVKVTGGAFKYNATTYFTDLNDNPVGENLNFYAANIDAKINAKLNLTASYLADKDDFAYKTTSVGLNYTGIKDFAVVGEFGQNDSDAAKVLNGGKAEAWMAQLKYRGAQADKVGSLGVWVGYRDAEQGFDPGELTTLDLSRFEDNAFGVLDNVKGPEFGVEYTVFKNGILTLQYNDLELKKAGTGVDKDKKNFFAHLIYTF